jgi:hypothetical protein
MMFFQRFRHFLEIMVHFFPYVDFLYKASKLVIHPLKFSFPSLLRYAFIVMSAADSLSPFPVEDARLPLLWQKY